MRPSTPVAFGNSFGDQSSFPPPIRTTNRKTKYRGERVFPLVTGACHSLFILALLSSFALSQVSVVTWHYNNGRTGANDSETLLTPANVSSSSFGLLFSQPVDGFIAGQPLYLPGVNIPGKGTHNVIYVATLHDSVYAFDADSATGENSQPLWVTSILTYSGPGAISAPASIIQGLTTTGFTERGIVSTPVIDSATNTMYLVAETYENQQVVHRLHALDVTTGLETLGGPTTITASFTSLDGQVATFNPLRQSNRPGLLLTNGHIYVAFGSMGVVNAKEQGWVMSYNARTLQQEGAFAVEPGLYYAAIWQHGAGISADASGNVYAGTAEGPYRSGTNLSETVLKLSQVGTTLSLADYFTPYNHLQLSTDDLDMADGVLALPDQPGPYPHELVAASKGKTIYVLDRDNMGRLCATCTTGDTQIVQEFDLPGLETGAPAYWNGRVYVTPGLPSGTAQAYAVKDGLLSLAAQSLEIVGSGHPFITSNGNKNGVLWTPGLRSVFALDAVTLKILYSTNQAKNQRDVPPPLVHSPMPIVANGRLYLGTTTTLAVYGLLPSLAVSGGNGQTAAVASTLPVPLQIQIINHYTGTPISGVTVTFSDGGKGGTFSDTTSVTDDTGTASTRYTLSSKSGSATVTASATKYQPATLSEMAVAGPATALLNHGGSAQTAPVSTKLPTPLGIIAEDRFKNLVAGAAVTFSDGGAGGTFSANPVLTNGNGLASVSYTTSTKAEKVTITASASGCSPSTLLETVTAGPATTIAVLSGNNQTGQVSKLLPHPLVSKVTDRYSNPVPSAPVTYSDGGAGGSFSSNSVTTDVHGNATVGYTTPSKAGKVTIQATASGVHSPAIFTEAAH
jgi:Bacterial Ig-like domain (group 1)